MKTRCCAVSPAVWKASAFCGCVPNLWHSLCQSGLQRHPAAASLPVTIARSGRLPATRGFESHHAVPSTQSLLSLPASFPASFIRGLSQLIQNRLKLLNILTFKHLAKQGAQHIRVLNFLNVLGNMYWQYIEPFNDGVYEEFPGI